MPRTWKKLRGAYWFRPEHGYVRASVTFSLLLKELIFLFRFAYSQES